MWKLIATYAPILGATLITCSLTIDEFHNWYDCLAGAVIGTIMAFSAYRMVYASVWDFRFNHIPLNRQAPFVYSAGPMELSHAVFTRKVGWGMDEGAFGGAPFDANGTAGAGIGAMAGTYGGREHHHTSYGNNYRNSVDRRPVGAPMGQRVHGDAVV